MGAVMVGTASSPGKHETLPWLGKRPCEPLTEYSPQ